MSRGTRSRSNYTKDELIKILAEAPSTSKDYFAKNLEGPAATQFLKYWDSWGEMLKELGYPPNRGTQNKNKDTLLYLINFGTFYKVGNTQRSLEDRFENNFLPYSVVALRVGSLVEIKRIEGEILDLVATSKYIPIGLKSSVRGISECFTATEDEIANIINTYF